MKIAAADAAMMARCAEDMFAPDVATPELDERMAGWRIIGYLSALNALFGLQLLGIGERVFYGFVASDNQEPANLVAVVRGTELPLEWISDMRFLPTRVGNCLVERGFWEIYQSMHFTPLGADLGDTAALAIADIVPNGATVTVIGHSLGAVLATYLCRDTAIAADKRFAVQGQFFASPKVGDQRYAANFLNAVGAGNYQTINYIGDLVPQMPPTGFYSQLFNTRWLRMGTVDLPDNAASNHDVLHYAARIRAEDTPVTTGEPA